MSYDPKCEELAEHFLADEGLTTEQHKVAVEKLSEQFQRVVGYFEFDLEEIRKHGKGAICAYCGKIAELNIDRACSDCERLQRDERTIPK